MQDQHEKCHTCSQIEHIFQACRNQDNQKKDIRDVKGKGQKELEKQQVQLRVHGKQLKLETDTGCGLTVMTKEYLKRRGQRSTDLK